MAEAAAVEGGWCKPSRWSGYVTPARLAEMAPWGVPPQLIE